MQILVPISLRSPFFPPEEYFFPKPLTEVAERPMVELVDGALRASFADVEFFFTLDRREARAFSLEHTLELAARPRPVTITEKHSETAGALCSCLLAVDVVDMEAPLLIVNSDQIIDDDLSTHVSRFEAAGADAGVITFESLHPRWSDVIEGDTPGEVTEAQEKRVVSRNAVAGVYYFSRAGLFFESASQVLLNDAGQDGIYYISAALNEVILGGGTVRMSRIEAARYHSFYAPSRIAAFERTPLAQRLRAATAAVSDTRVIIPAAGAGSRFARAGWAAPKPFIDVAGQPMLEHVIANVTPAGAQTTLLLRRDHIETQTSVLDRLRREGREIVPVDGLTEGTACTVLLARRSYDDDAPMLVANSDQLVDFDVAAFVQDCLDRDLDGSILCFPDPARDPKWSFARTDAAGLVVEVAEKRPISDLATVGIYLFRRGRDFVSAAADMLAANDRVNGEFYTCPVYNYMIRAGARIGVYRIPAGAMHGLGTPEDLEAYLARTGAGPSAHAPGPAP
jgi:NDP-sugar pyrophosphorylase family protein